jgi:hypothetical protein
MADAQLPPPVVLALLVADNHILDSRASQHTIVGVFSQIRAERFPTMLTRLCIYAELTNGRGKRSVQIRVIDADESRPPVIDAGVELEFNDPLDVSQVGFSASGVVFPSAGEYRVQLLCAGAMLMERRLMVFQAPANSGFQSPPTTPFSPAPQPPPTPPAPPASPSSPGSSGAPSTPPPPSPPTPPTQRGQGPEIDPGWTKG